MLKKITFEVERFCGCQNNTVEWILGIHELKFRCAQCQKMLLCINPMAYVIVKNPEDFKAPNENEKVVPKERPWPPTIAYYRKELEKFLNETLSEKESIVVEPKKEMIH